jgi:hypothetical protein
MPAARARTPEDIARRWAPAGNVRYVWRYVCQKHAARKKRHSVCTAPRSSVHARGACVRMHGLALPGAARCQATCTRLFAGRLCRRAPALLHVQ